MNVQENLNTNSQRSVLKNLLVSMLAFGLAVGLLFPPFARIVLKTDRALTPIFFVMCVAAGLVVGIANFSIFRVVVSRELIRLQEGMYHVNENIKDADLNAAECENDCALEVASRDIIGDITQSFNNMTWEIFNRLKLESQTRRLNASLMQHIEVEAVAADILRNIADTIQAPSGLLYSVAADRLRLLSHFGADIQDEMKENSLNAFGPLHQAITSAEVRMYSQEDGWSWIGHSTPIGKMQPCAIVLVPLTAKQKAVGLVVLTAACSQLNPQQLAALNALRAFAAPNLDNAMLHRKITELAAVDDLTMILNRRFGLRRLKEEFSRSLRHGIPLSIVMADIDHFKDFNDTFGHDAGDEVLKMVAAALESNLRAEDMVCRYGGEEFMLMLTGAGMVDACQSAERIRRAVETTELRWANKHLSVTLSMGAATYPIARASVCEELITQADAALYAAKSFGRNQVAFFNGESNIRFDTKASKKN